MEKQVDLRGIYFTEAVAAQAENILRETNYGRVSFVLSSGECASCVALEAFKQGWEMKLDYRNECYTLMLYKEMQTENCA